MYARLVVLVLFTDLCLSALIGFAVYLGFSIYPVTLTGDFLKPDTAGFRLFIPLWMPSIQDLRSPLSFLSAREIGSVFWTILMSVVVLIAQSFVRAIYLGGIKSVVLHEAPRPLIEYGRHYFKRILGWSILNALAASAGIFVVMSFGWVGVIVFVAMLFYVLVPYLIVLFDCSVYHAMSIGPRLFSQTFWRLFAYALLTMMVTGLISISLHLPKPIHMYVAMLVYSTLGTLLIVGFMRRLAQLLRSDGYLSALRLNTTPIKINRLHLPLMIGLIVLLPAAGVGAASGFHVATLDRLWSGPAQELPGVSYFAAPSDVWMASDYLQDSYTWLPKTYRIETRIPDLSDGRTRDAIRGTAVIRWDEDIEVATKTGYTTHIRVETVEREKLLLFRLGTVRSEDGSIYYSSQNGFASIISLKDKSREPMSVEMALSGDGKNLFVLKYPTRFEAGPVFRMSQDGRFAVPTASRINTGDFDTYWFTRDLQKQDVFDMLEAKNKRSGIGSQRKYIQLAVALQEADGGVVIRALKAIEAGGASIDAPEWNAQQWTAHLRSLYDNADLAETLAHLSKSGAQFGYIPEKLPPTEVRKNPVDALLTTPGMDTVGEAPKPNESPVSYRLEVPFPSGTIDIRYTEVKGVITKLELRIDDSV